MVESEEVCLRHIIGRSRREYNKDHINSPEEQYCHKCEKDESNRNCPNYLGIKLTKVDIQE